MSTAVTLMTPPTPGAIAVLQLTGGDTARVLAAVTGRADWPVGHVALADLAGEDHGLAVRLKPGVAQLMPHGGPGVIRRLLARLTEYGVAMATLEAADQARTLYPEADSDLEADVLAAIARAASPAAIDLLARQVPLWQGLADRGDTGPTPPEGGDPRDRLLQPPTVVVVGRPNVGKSTLANALAGRTVSIVADLPGTTRDWVGNLLELPGGIAVQWLDTPGIRDSADAIEQAAIQAARTVVAQADVLIAMRDPETDWPAPADLPRTADLRVVNKIDDAPPAGPTDPELQISADADRNVNTLQSRVTQMLKLRDLAPERPWRFSAALRAQPDAAELRRYCGRDG